MRYAIVLLCQIAIPVPLAHAFTYAVPAGMEQTITPGSRVLCEFRRSKTIGVVLSVGETAPPDHLRDIKPIESVLDARPCVPRELLDFLLELSNYYLAPIGEVLKLALPAIERSTLRELRQRGLGRAAGRGVGGRVLQVAVATELTEMPARLGSTAKRVLEHLRAVGEAPISQLAATFPSVRAVVGRLRQKGLVTIVERERPQDAYFTEPVARDSPFEPTGEQAEAIASIDAALRAGSADSFLLHGITGSGKTEVYLRAIATCRELGRGSLVLVPEIALTPQLVARFRARFGEELAVIHSGLGERDRYEMWTALREAKVRVAIGARSALFAPVHDVGLVVVDEEHDTSFKQEEGVRYHARDMALLRARRARAVCVLGSATPSVESEALVRAGKLRRLVLRRRAPEAASLPTVELVDLRNTGPGPSGHALLSAVLHRAIEKALSASEQVILFLNRRGFAPSVLCEGCESISTCPHCSVSLTLHRTGGGHLRCHYCDYDIPMWISCPKCRSDRHVLIGLGTERLEETLEKTFAGARVLRLDRDVAAGAKSEAVLARMKRREADILVGTQMVTKGHDLPDVTLVGVVNADAALSLPDFRASERTFQLLVQVAGRAGRADRPGRVLVQTRLPDHPAVHFALRHDVAGFLEHELRNRREAGYPPSMRLALVRLDASDQARVRDEAARLAQIGRDAPETRRGKVELLGPSPAPIERLRGRYRFRVLLRAKERPALHAVARVVQTAAQKADRHVRIGIDIDPVQLL